MALGSVSIGGIVSGFDTDSIIEKLTELQKRPLEELDAREGDLNSKLQATLDFNTRLLALKTRADKLSSSSLYQTRTATSSDPTVFTATATGGKDVGNYTLSVERLATQHQLISQGYADETDEVGTGTVTIQVGTATYDALTLDEDNNTLEGLRDAINEAGYGVRASILDDGSSTSPKRLVLTSDTSGEDGEITVTFDLSGGTAPTTTDLQAAQNALVKLGTGASAVEIESSKNTLTTLVPGVTVNLLKAEPGVTRTLTVNSDTGALRKAVEDTLTSYNQINTYLREQFAYDPKAETVGALFGDRTAQTVQGRLGNALLRSAWVDGEYSSLNEIGITVDKAGALSITDSDAFSKALANPAELQKLFADEDNGVATRLASVLKQATDTVSGTLTTAQNSFKKQIEALDQSRVALEERLANAKAALIDQFTRMESALGSLKSQSSMLAAQLGSMSLLSTGSSDD